MINELENKIVVILGPTASGKSAAAIQLAKKFDGEIISADSRQIYRGMDIGSGKVPKSECKNQKENLQSKNKLLRPYCSEDVPHYIIDIVSPNTDYNAAKFKHDAEKVIRNILSRKKLPIICGGTGFWIKAVVDNVDFPEVKPDWKLREELDKQSAEKLFQKLKKIDPERAANIDAKNKVRLIRAIEICKSIGKVPALPPASSSHQGKIRNELKFLQIGIQRDKERLDERIRKNVEKRFSMGMIEEVEKIHKQGVSWKKIQSFGLSYNLIPEYLKGNIESKEELNEKIYLAEKNYAKRQMTWFKKDKRIIWLDNYKKIEKETQKFLEK
ncbi:MAG: tRNA dimethylallyltransferase [uncultured bacterium]|nr:MAG: tRNA dimethylallyltransferase [uncultured bacterium]HBR71478.1 tRNA (adenosine(37)-N6)-dimethylallyltransferase MiaA [Candidatus Moranbacteria bacterium]